jgi:hypothetical protein
MKFTAQITVEVEADTFASAADHEREINKLYQEFRARYGECRLEIKQRRVQHATPAKTRTGRIRHTGNLAQYGT